MPRSRKRKKNKQEFDSSRMINKLSTKKADAYCKRIEGLFLSWLNFNFSFTEHKSFLKTLVYKSQPTIIIKNADANPIGNVAFVEIKNHIKKMLDCKFIINRVSNEYAVTYKEFHGVMAALQAIDYYCTHFESDRNFTDIKDQIENEDQFSFIGTFFGISAFQLANKNGFLEAIKVCDPDLVLGGETLQVQLLIGKHSSVKKNFFLNNIKRNIFQLFDLENNKHLVVSGEKIDDKYKGTMMNIFLQSHAYHRLIERLQPLTIDEIYFCFLHSMHNAQVHNFGSHQYLTLHIDNNILGYFPLIVIDDMIILKSFLFVTNISTPTGQALSKKLFLSKTEIIEYKLNVAATYVGTVDTKYEPIKEAYNQCGLGYLWKIFNNLCSTISLSKSKSKAFEKWCRVKEENQAYFKKNQNS